MRSFVLVGGAAFLLSGTAAAQGSRTQPAAPTAAAPSAGFEGFRAGRVAGFADRAFALRVAGDGDLYVTLIDEQRLVRQRDGDSAAVWSVPTGALPVDIAIADRLGLVIVSTKDDDAIEFFAQQDGQPRGRLAVGQQPIRLLLSPDESRLWVTTADGELYAVDVATRRVLGVLQLAGSLQGLAYDARRQQLVVSSADGQVYLVDAESLERRLAVWLGGRPQDVVISPDGATAFVAQEDVGRVATLDAATLQERGALRFYVDDRVEPFGLAISPDGRTVLVGSARTGRVAVVDVATRTTRRVLEGPDGPRRLAFSRDGLTAYVAHESGVITRLR
jgi:DNA-binding beta-propeller fold protein YncE